MKLRDRWTEFSRKLVAKTRSRQTSANSKTLAWSWCDARLDMSAVAIAFVVTIFTFLLINAWVNSRIDRAYEAHRFAALSKITNPGEAADVLIQVRAAEPQLREWLAQHLDLSLPTPKIIEKLFRSIAVSEATQDEQRSELLRELATGNRSLVWGLFYENLSMPTPANVFEELAKTDPSWQSILNKSELGEPQKKAMVHLVADLLTVTETPIRDGLRFNGWVQWLTIAMAWLVVILIARRYLTVNRLAKTASRWDEFLGETIYSDRSEAEKLWGNVPLELTEISRLFRSHQQNKPSINTTERTLIFQDQFQKLDADAQNQVYGSLGFLVGCLPSLGFIGTVLGMGEALLLANGLLTSSDRERTIAEMTQQLGFAFDTTLVALVCGLLVGFGLFWIRGREKRLLQQLESLFTTRLETNQVQIS